MLRLTTLAITQGSSFDNDIEITGVQAMFSTCMKIHFKDYTVLQLAENPFQLWCIQMLWKIISNTLLVLGTITKITRWCGFQFVDVEISTISNLNINPVTTTIWALETNCSSNQAIWDGRMTSKKPALIVCSAVAWASWVRSCHLFTDQKSVPAFW